MLGPRFGQSSGLRVPVSRGSLLLLELALESRAFLRELSFVRQSSVSLWVSVWFGELMRRLGRIRI